jgi:hypothetical protein
MLKLTLLFCLLAFGVTQEREQSVSRRTPVEVSFGTESEFKQKLGKLLIQKFQSSSEFSLNQMRNPDALIVTIVSYLDWKDGSEISYTVEFSSGLGEILGISVGACMNDALVKCTTQILKDARTAAWFLVNPAPEVIRTTIPEIKANPMKYDERVVQIGGYYSSGHLGVSLDTKDHGSGIRLRSPGEDAVLCPVPILRNELFSKFWNMGTEILAFDPNNKEINAIIEGYVRVLKVNGKPADEFDVFGQWPLEIVVTRIISIDIEEAPMKGKEHPPLLHLRSRNQFELPAK